MALAANGSDSAYWADFGWIDIVTVFSAAIRKKIAKIGRKSANKLIWNR